LLIIFLSKVKRDQMKFRTIAKKMLISLIGLPALAVAELESLDEVNELATVEVHGGRGRSLLGVSGSASQGEVGQPQFEYRPMSRAGELVEVIPGALATQHNSVGRVISTGATIEHPQGWFASLRLRHFGHVPLDQQGSFWAGDTNIVNFGTGYKQKNYKFEIDLFNLLGSNNSDLAYAYCSQMKGEANNSNCPDGGTGTFGLMRHPVEPRMVRGTVTVNF
jgi:hypothetical protein